LDTQWTESAGLTADLSGLARSVGTWRRQARDDIRVDDSALGQSAVADEVVGVAAVLGQRVVDAFQLDEKGSVKISEVGDNGDEVGYTEQGGMKLS
jgi:hypothetical protein